MIPFTKLVIDEMLMSYFRHYGQMKSRDGKSQRRKSEGKVREDKRRKKRIKEEKVRRKKMQAPEKVGKLRNIVFSTDLWPRRVEK